MDRTGFGTLAIFGNGPRAVELVLRRVLRYRDVAGPLLILDYIGRGAQAIGSDAAASLGKREVLWIDLADRQRPAGLFSPTATPYFESVMASALRGMRNLARVDIKEESIEWAGVAAGRLARDGEVGLAAVLRCLSSQATRRWYLDTHPDTGDLGRLIDLVNRALKYPAIYSLSEGNNRIRLSESLRLPRNIWIEIPAEHFEPAEHAMVVHLVNCAVQDAMLSLENDMRAVQPRERPFIIHMFPPAAAEPFPRWVSDTVPFARHVAVFHVDSGRTPSRAAVEWSRQAEQVWLLGGMNDLDPKVHGVWLEPRDLEILKNLKADSMLVRAGGAGGTSRIVAGIGIAEGVLPHAHGFRMKASKTRVTSTFSQLSTAAGEPFSPGDRLADMYQRLCNRDVLRWAWSRVNTHNLDSCGVDNVTIRQFRDNIERELDTLVEELETRSYRCRPLKRIEIPKQDGGKRPIGLPCVRDRLVQTACLVLMEPVFDPTFSYSSFGFRPGRNAHHALAMARSMIAAGRGWVVAADIQKCFDSIDHEILRGLLEVRIGDPEFLDVIEQFIGADVLDSFELIPTDLGVPQGESLSPLLANIYLDLFDRHCEKLGLGFVRYADDFVILAYAREEAEKALESVNKFLAEVLRLRLKPSKTFCVPVDDGFDFLGFRIAGGSASIQTPRKERVVELVRTELKELGSAQASLKSRAIALVRLNAIVRGFRNYFGQPGDKSIAAQMVYLDGRVEQMGAHYLPPAIRDDPAWICRERFSFPAIEESSQLGRKAEYLLSTAVGGYGSVDIGGVAPDNPANRYWSHDGQEPARPELIVKDAGVSRTGDRDVSIVESEDRLFVLTGGGYLMMDGDDLVVSRRQKEMYRRPMGELALVYLQGFSMNISVNLQVRLAQLDIPVVFAPPLGDPMAVLSPVKTEKSFLRGQQVIRRDDPDIVSAAVDMLSAKVGNQAAVLKYFARYRVRIGAEGGQQLVDAAAEVARISKILKGLDPRQADIRPIAMGYEGQAAAMYWGALSTLAPPDLDFEGRITRHARDVVNQCVNYVYGILYGEVWRILSKYGLDPYFGFMHGSKRNQGSLVFDLIEEFRAPFADRFVFGMLGRGFKPKIGEHGHLRVESKCQLAQGFSRRWSEPVVWRSRRMTPGQVLEHQAASLVRLIERKGKYLPYRARI